MSGLIDAIQNSLTPTRLGTMGGRPFLRVGNDADKNAKALSRAQYQDYLRRYKPVEDQLIAGTLQPPQPTVDKAHKLAQLGFDIEVGSRARMKSRYGLAADPNNRLDKLAKAAMVSKVDYDTARQLRDINLDRLGKMVAFGKGLSTQSGDTLMSAARNEAARKNAKAQMDAQADAARMQTLGSLASAALIAFA